MAEDTITDRGFRHAPPVAGSYGGEARVYESSAASAPHVWVGVVDHQDGDAAVHLTLEAALEYAENIVRVCRLHYQCQENP